MIRIDVLPDDVLLEIFDFCTDVDPSVGFKRRLEAWHLLVHVCRRWRSIVFGSPRSLDLRLVCTTKTPARDTLDVWPALPLIIRTVRTWTSGVDEIIVALGQSNRVCEVELADLPGFQLKEVVAAMQVPFPELTVLRLSSDPNGRTTPIDPDLFMGGSAPRLQVFESDLILFPGLPKLLFSATHLDHLDLRKIPQSRYFSPETMAALLSVLSSLKTLFLHFQLPQSHPDWVNRRPPPSKRSVVPALVHFHFKGVIEYFGDLVTFVDVPHLSNLNITINQIDFDGPRLAQFISRTPILEDRDAHVDFDFSAATVRLPSPLKDFAMGISCSEPDWQLSSIAQVCNSCLPPLSMIEDLYISYGELVWLSTIENNLLEFLLPFSTVKNLYLPKEFVQSIMPSLQEIVRTEVLPSLQNIFMEGLEPLEPFQESIGQFIAT